jgi:hypothetical protein
MYCKQIDKQTKGKIREIELAGLICSQAEICRRKGICSLSPYSHPELIKTEKPKAPPAETAGDDSYPEYYEVLLFKKSLGFQWVRARNFEDAVQAIQGRPGDEDHPKLIRRVEFFKLPDWE